jgi:peptidylprolyl isomerase
MAARPLCVVLLLLLLAAPALAACGDDEEDPANAGETDTEQTDSTETSPSAQREALRDTSTKPVIPRPTGSPPRRLVKDDIVRGEGRAAKRGDLVTVHYAGVTFSTGEEFDASWNTGETYTFPLGAGPIPGWDKGLVGMKQGGRRMLTIPPELAYGSEGNPPAIGPNETLVFVFDMVDIRR